MKRTAILANASSGSATGAQLDLEHWHSFLVSPLGGAWLEGKEVHVLSNPSKDDIVNLVRPAVSDDYAIVVFFGHGELRKDRLGFPEIFLSIKGSDSISERELNPRNNRCSIFIDPGRSVPGKSLEMQAPRSEEIKLSRARQLFDSEIAKAEEGCVKIYADNLSQEAQHDHSFSARLLDQSVEWARREHGTLDLKQAIALTSDQLKRIPPSQGPRYQAGRRLHHFPFAVNPKV